MMFTREGDWLSAEAGEERMMSAEQGKYLGLSGVGARIRELIETPQSLERLCAVLLAEFDVTEDVRRAEVDAFMKVLA